MSLRFNNLDTLVLFSFALLAVFNISALGVETPSLADLYPNVALNMNSSQGPGTQNGGNNGNSETYASFHAVDGNLSITQEDCAQTRSSNKQIQWWMVDLGTVKDIQGVAVLSPRLAQSSDQLENITVDVFTEDPREMLGFPEVIEMLCAHRSEPVGSGEWAELSCGQFGPVAGRYVRVVKDAGQPLTLCEVEVYATLLTMKRAYRSFSNTLTLTEPQEELGVFSSAAQCAQILMLRPELNAFGFNLATGLCMGRSTFTAGISYFVEDADWVDYEMTDDFSVASSSSAPSNSSSFEPGGGLFDLGNWTSEEIGSTG